jgi:hypothetical protein
MYSPVTVLADDNGMVIRQSKNNPEYGFVVLQQSRTMIQSNPANLKNVGWLKTQKMTTLLKGKMEELKMFGFTKGMELPGKIVVKESTTPFSEENPDQHLKIAGDTGIVCCIYGEPIYRITYYTADPNEQDEFVQHDNVDAIRSANGVTSNSNKISAVATATIQEAFDLKDDSNDVEEVDDAVEEVIVDDLEDTFEL